MRRALLILALSLLATPSLGSRSSYGPSGSGTKAFFLLLSDLGYQTARAFDLREVDPSTQLLVIVGLPSSAYQGPRWLELARQGKALLIAPPLEEEAGLCRSYKLGELELKRSQRLTAFTNLTVEHPELKLRSSACVLSAPTAATVLAGRPDQALAIVQPVGEGRVLALAHEDLLVNDNLDRDDLVVVLRRWLSVNVPAGARVTFLEEKQGGQLLDLIKRSNLTAFALHSLLWLLLLYWALAPRFGDPFPPAGGTRRAFAEHARALGALYRHRGASGAMLQNLLERFLARQAGRSERRPHQAAVRLGEVGVGRGRPALAAALATRTGRDVDSVESLLAQLERAVQEGPSNDPKQILRHFRLSQSLAALSRGSTARSLGGSRARKGRSGVR